MAVITMTFAKNVQDSVQVGDMIYRTQTTNLLDGSNKKGSDINASDRVGILRKIENVPGTTTYDLYVDDDGFNASVANGDYIMFSKYNQSDEDIKGYYMEVKLINNSKQKAELFTLSSEVTESSK